MSRIVFLLSQSLDSPSGLGRYSPLARELAKLGHEVDIFALHPAFSELDKTSLEVDGVQVHYVAQMHVTKSGDSKSYFTTSQLVKVTLKATWHLSRSAISMKADIVHIGKPHPMNSIAGLCAKIINRSRLYLDCDDYEARSGRFNSHWQKSIITIFEKWMPRQVKLITTNTIFMRNKLIGWGIPAEKIMYLPNGVDRNRFSKADPGGIESLRAELNLGSKKVIGYIGSLSLPSHPVNLLLEAFHKIHEYDQNTILMLVGGGEDMNLLSELAQELGISRATRFCGRVPPEKIPLYYALADVSVDPVYDNDAARGRSPLKLFESWACGVPFVTADVGDRKSLLGDPPAGLLAQPGNPESLAELIQQVLSVKALANSVAEAGKLKVKDYYWDRLAIEFSKIYSNHSQI
jgi:glycosyltransferase involved in cell wall biosynthesis